MVWVILMLILKNKLRISLMWYTCYCHLILKFLMAKRMYKLLETVLVILSFSYEKLTPYIGIFTILITFLLY